MDLKIVKIHGEGDQDEEYVVLEVLHHCNVGDYLLADSTYTSANEISNRVRHTYFFLDKTVKKGEFIVLRTGSGTDSSVTKSGKVVHTFFWNLKEAVWNDAGDCAVLLKIEDWEHFPTKAE